MSVTNAPSAQEVAALRRKVRRTALTTLGASIGKSLVVGLSTIVIVLVIWVSVLTLFHVVPFIGKGPDDVWQFLFVDDDAVDNRAELLMNLGITLKDSVIGFVAGLIVAIVGAIVFRLSRGIENSLMPVALLLRSVPLVAMTPIIILIFGYENPIGTVATIGGIVVLFPALVTIVFGLKAASPQMLDVVAVYGGNTFTAVRKVALPGSLPSLFAAIRISVPGAITGALLAEWLSTGQGIGAATAGYVAQAKFPDLWASVVVVTGVSLILYTVVQVLEAIVLSRMGMTAAGQSTDSKVKNPIAATGGAFAALGIIWILLYWGSEGTAPAEPFGTSNVIIGLVLGLVGVVLAIVALALNRRPDATTAKMNWFAIVGFILTVTTVVPGLVISHIALFQIWRRKDRGWALGVVSLCIGYAALVALLAFSVLAAVPPVDLSAE